MNRNLPETPRYGRRAFPQFTPPEANTLELGALIAALRRNKWLILLCVIAATGIAMMVLSTVRPSYDSYTEVLLETRKERVTGIEQVISDLSVNNSVVAGEVAVLHSNLLIGRVVDKLDLIHHPEFNPYRVTEPGLLGRLLQPALAQLDAWRGIEPRPDVEVENGALSPEDARNLVIWQVKRDLTVAQSGIAYVIGISVQTEDPDIAAAIANAVAAQYLLDQQAIKHAATQQAVKWLDTRLAGLETQLRSAEDAVVDFLAERSLEEGGNEASVTQQLTELNRTYVDARTERALAAAKLDHARKLVADGGYDAAEIAVTSPRLVALDQEKADLQRRKAQLGTRLGPKHPEMIDLQSAIDDTDRDREAAIKSGLDEIEADLLLAQGREQSLDDDIAAAHRRLVELSRSSVRLRQLERSASAMRQVYESFLARFQETTQQLEFQSADARIITEALPAPAPSRPRKKLILAVAMVTGGILGMVASLIREVMNRTVRNAADAVRVTQLPVLGALPRVRRRGRGGAWQMLELKRSRLSPYAEGLRLLRAALMSTRSDARPRVIMFTGTEAGVGTSSAALGLARVVAALGKRVVVVDANLRRPSLHTLLGLEGVGLGIVGYVQGQAEIDDVLVLDAESNVTAVPAWHGRQNAADLVSTVSFRKAIEVLSGKFDLVILDAPPAVGVADAKVLAGLADICVVVARAGASREGALTAAVMAIEEAGGLVAGTVLSHSAHQSRWRIGSVHAAPVYETAS